MLTYSDYFLTLFVVLAFALADTKKIILCDVEKPESLHSFSVEAPVSCMQWTEVTVESR